MGRWHVFAPFFQVPEAMAFLEEAACLEGLCLYSCVDQNVSNSEVWIQAHPLPPTEPVKMHRRPPSLPQSLPWAQGHKLGGSCPLKALGLWPHPSSSPAVWGAITPNTSDLCGEPKACFSAKS